LLEISYGAKFLPAGPKNDNIFRENDKKVACFLVFSFGNLEIWQPYLRIMPI